MSATREGLEAQLFTGCCLRHHSFQGCKYRAGDRWIFKASNYFGDYARGKADDHDSDSGEEEEETQGEEFKNDAMMLTSYSD